MWRCSARIYAIWALHTYLHTATDAASYCSIYVRKLLWRCIARFNAICAMVAMSHHNLGAMHEATKRADMTELNYKRAHDIAEQYLGPASQIAGTQFSGFTCTKVQTLTQKLEEQ